MGYSGLGLGDHDSRAKLEAYRGEGSAFRAKGFGLHSLVERSDIFGLFAASAQSWNAVPGMMNRAPEPPKPHPYKPEAPTAGATTLMDDQCEFRGLQHGSLHTWNAEAR